MKFRYFCSIVCVSALSWTQCSFRNKFNIVEGLWAIDTVLFIRQDVSSCMNMNVIYLGKDSNCDFSSIDKSCTALYSSEDVNGQWAMLEVDREPLKLRIKSSNFFNGTHKVVFFKDETNRIFKMRIESDSLIVVCKKGLLDYKANLNQMEVLIELTHRSR
jgi:hypothetical protein